jgi:hypothetical protein
LSTHSTKFEVTELRILAAGGDAPDLDTVRVLETGLLVETFAVRRVGGPTRLDLVASFVLTVDDTPPQGNGDEKANGCKHISRFLST